MKNAKGYTLMGMIVVVSVLTVGAITTINQLVSGGKTAKEITASEVSYSTNRTESILLSIRDARGE